MPITTHISPHTLVPTQPSFIYHMSQPLTMHPSLVHTLFMHPSLRPCVLCPCLHVLDMSVSLTSCPVPSSMHRCHISCPGHASSMPHWQCMPTCTPPTICTHLGMYTQHACMHASQPSFKCHSCVIHTYFSQYLHYKHNIICVKVAHIAYSQCQPR